jgi:putative zinc finger/helix-turn-helix YgiT family protein
MNCDDKLNPMYREQNDELRCPNCGHQNIRTTSTEDTFTYGEGKSAVKLTVTVPLRTCLECRFQFLDAASEDAHHEAICRHLRVMTPSEIQALRRKYALSRGSLAQITKLGAATIARWERGELIQNAAYDQLLYLLTFEENLQRLESRNEARFSASVATSTPPCFRLVGSDADRAAASGFELRRIRRGA